MHRLPRARKIANDQLIKHLAKFGYSPAQQLPGLWKHKHLIKALQQLYTIAIDHDGNLFCGYIKADLEQFKHPITNINKHAPHAYARLQYKLFPQMVPLKQELPGLSKPEKTQIQQ
eukprot:9977330-Ditylum_brightwellii.AAC.1